MGMVKALKWASVAVLALGPACRSKTTTGPTTAAAPAASETPSEPGEATRRPDAELQALTQCSHSLERVYEVGPEARAAALAEAAPAIKECGRLLFERCEVEGVPEVAHAAALVLHVIAGCLARYCDDLEPRPAMCHAGVDAFAALNDRTAAEAQASEMIAAMLALDYGRPPGDAAIDRIAVIMAPLWAMPIASVIHVEPPAFAEKPDDPLDLVVRVGSGGITLRGKGMAEVSVPADDDVALAAAARKAKDDHPGAREVVVRADDSVPMTTLVRVLDALRGECNEALDNPECLFPLVTIDTSP